MGRNSGHICVQEKSDFYLGILAVVIWEPEGGGEQMSYFGFLIINLVLECPANLPPLSSSLLLPSVVNLIQILLRHEETQRKLKSSSEPLPG